MLELGGYSEELHRKVGMVVSQNNLDILITVGEEARYIADEAYAQGFDAKNIYAYKNNDEAIQKLKQLIQEGNASILVKASNGMHFGEIINSICKK